MIDFIEIKSDRISFISGFGRLKIYRQENIFLLECNYYWSNRKKDKVIIDKEPIACDYVFALLNAVKEPVAKKSEFLNCDIILNWFYKYKKIFGLPEQLVVSEDALNRLVNTNYINNKAITNYFKTFGGTDDYPNFEVRITLTDGEVITLSSTIQRQLMIPWSITNSSGSYETSNMNINLALMDLLPDGFINKKRIIGEGFMANILKLNLKKTREL